MELINKQEEINYRISPDKSYTKKELILYKSNLICQDILPAHWINRSFRHFENTELKTEAEKLFSWNFKNPIIAGMLSALNGIGKTYLAGCIMKKYIYERLLINFDKKNIEADNIEQVNEWLNEIINLNVCFLSEKKLALEIQESFDIKKLSQLQIIEKYCNYDFLIIDDLFSMKQNEFARQNVFYIIDERIDYKQNPTFITSNLLLNEIADIDTRIADRLRSNLLFQITKNIESFRKINLK